MTRREAAELLDRLARQLADAIDDTSASGLDGIADRLDRIREDVLQVRCDLARHWVPDQTACPACRHLAAHGWTEGECDEQPAPPQSYPWYLPAFPR